MHIGVIPDGNRRFMRKIGIRNLGQAYGLGINKFQSFVGWCIDLEVKEVTVYALSTENLKNRSGLEIRTLMSLFSRWAQDKLKDGEVHEKGIKVNVCGDRESLLAAGGKDLLLNLGNLEESTRDNSTFNLNLALGYGGRQEIVSAANNAAKSGLPLTIEDIERNLWVKGSPDLIIRTSEARLSNFLPWQSAYSEIYFVDKLWQELEKKDLESVIEDYNSKERRFGR